VTFKLGSLCSIRSLNMGGLAYRGACPTSRRVRLGARQRTAMVRDIKSVEWAEPPALDAGDLSNDLRADLVIATDVLPELLATPRLSGARVPRMPGYRHASNLRPERPSAYEHK
jgi:hypothetical protein